jgi:hypothetical protein
VRENAICPPTGVWIVNVLESTSSRGEWPIPLITIQTAQSELLITI